jgi:transglutaminase-like putative cysteine protease
VKRVLAVFLFGGAAALGASEQSAVYRAVGADARLFDQYDNDGYSLEVSAGANGSVELKVRVSDSPLASNAPFPARERPRAARVAAPDRDAFARGLAAGSRTEAEAVRRVLLGLAARVAYDPDRLRRQDPGAVFSSGRAYCVGFAELAVDLLARIGIAARTVQGVLTTEPGADGYEANIGGAFHRWIEVYYPDRGYVFSDPLSSVNGVDARYVAFSRRAWTRPHNLALTALSRTGDLSYDTLRAGDKTLRVRATSPEAAAR